MTCARKPDCLKNHAVSRNSKHACQSKKGGFVKRFLRSEDGSYTIESVIWLPIYVFILAIMMNVSMVFFTESQLQRVVQDSNRSFSVGRITTLSAVEQYVINRISYLGANPVVNSQLVDGIIYTDLSIAAVDLMPFSMLHKFFASTTVVISAQQIVEF
jgi:Flp pilus assembly protein TadG